MSRSAAQLLCLTLAVAGLAAVAAPASASPYYVVAEGSGPQGLRPEPRLRLIPTPPAGVTLRGSVRCGRVHLPGGGGQTQVADNLLPAGTYQFVTSSCASDPSDPVRLEGTTEGFRLLGGTFVLDRSPTYMEAAAVMEASDEDDPVVGFAANVYSAVKDGLALRNERVVFGFQRKDGFWELDACTAVTADTFEADAECTLTGDAARRFREGPGEWRARFDGGRDDTGSSASGRVEGTFTDPASAAKFLENILNDPANQVTIVKQQLPPGCFKPNDQTGVSIIGISLDQLSCDQIQILQIVTDIALGIALSGGSKPAAVAAKTVALVKKGKTAAVAVAKHNGAIKATEQLKRISSVIDEAI